MTDSEDFDLDQSTRVKQRVSNGVYRISRGRQQVGEELWQILALRNGLLRLMSEISMTWPVPNLQRIRYDLDADWRAQGLWIEVEAQGHRFTGTFTPEPEGTLHARVIEAPIQRDEPARPKKDGAAAETAGLLPATGRLIRDGSLPFPAGARLDFNSAMFNFAILKQLQIDTLTPAQSTFNSIVITLPQLAPVLVRQTYAYFDRQPPKGEQYDFPVLRYRISETGNPDAVTDFWTNERGIVLRQHVLLEGSSLETHLVRYDWAA